MVPSLDDCDDGEKAKKRKVLIIASFRRVDQIYLPACVAAVPCTLTSSTLFPRVPAFLFRQRSRQGTRLVFSGLRTT